MAPGEACWMGGMDLRKKHAQEKGFTYLWVIFLVAVTGLALAGAGQLWRTEARREKEKELMFVGEQFRRAIGSYYESSPGTKRYPDSLEKLLSDDRFPTVKRHLRKIFIDPMTGAAEWGLIRQPGHGITGVYSLSARAPLKRANFHERYTAFKEAESYRDWKFVYLPGDAGGALPQPKPGPQAQSPSDTKPSQPQPQPETEPQPERRLPQIQPESQPVWDPFSRRQPDSPSSDPAVPVDSGAQWPGDSKQ
ncbi:type II secretion system protein [Nitrosovibrio sp. Nv6]|uniref:type II secretion system protein n=1 Tax=Nitrosovibrio sp. Nv6 TaxID=1855340 RepID=UPI000A5F1DF3|nr:type II secretion system protein [Nitrosovibrio sp. Nv6]